MGDLATANGKNSALGKQVCDQEQRINELEQENAELISDYSKVLDYVTDGMVSKTNTKLDVIYKMIDKARESHCKAIYVNYLEQENQELVAHCEVLVDKTKEFICCPSDIKTLFELKDLVYSTNKTSIANIKADAIEEAIESLTKWSCMETYAVTIDDICEYTDKLRKQGND